MKKKLNDPFADLQFQPLSESELDKQIASVLKQECYDYLPVTFDDFQDVANTQSKAESPRPTKRTKYSIMNV